MAYVQAYDRQGAELVSPDAGLTLQYKLVAAKAGYALAEQDVGVLYARGEDVPLGLLGYKSLLLKDGLAG